ncbi:MAG: type 1 glutamine amidotransferase [Pseudomonadota bacterium]
MHIAVLVTNTDDSAFARRHPKDPQKFDALVKLARPHWRTTSFWTTHGALPARLDDYDGFIVGGSPASVNGGAAFIPPLLKLLKQLVQERRPLFGACFGHQAIAAALGCQIVRNLDGWVFGLHEHELVTRRPWMHDDEPERLALYAAHVEQVASLPPAATLIARSPACEVAGFAIGEHLFTTQYHPEMSHDFITALVDELSPEMGAEVTARARESLTRSAQTHRFAEWLARFFEAATR